MGSSEPSLLAKASHWLAESLIHGMRLQCELAAIDQPKRDEVARAAIGRLIDSELRLALALEAYGEIVRGGDQARAEACVTELETPTWAERKEKTRRRYDDPIQRRDGARFSARDLTKKKKQLARLKREGATGPEVRALEREIKFRDRLGD